MWAVGAASTDHVTHLAGGGPPRETGDLQPGHQLVGARQRKAEEAVHVLAVQVGAAGGDLAQSPAVLLRPAAEGRPGGELGGEQDAAAGRDGGWARPSGSPAGHRPARERGRWRRRGRGGPIRWRNGGGERGGGGAGGLADAPLAAEETEGGKGGAYDSPSPPRKLTSTSKPPPRETAPLARRAARRGSRAAGQDVRLEGREFLLVDLAQLHPHLRGQQLLAQASPRRSSPLDRRGDLVEDERDAADQEAVEDDHIRPPSRARASAGC